jgi:hypothetical protein
LNEREEDSLQSKNTKEEREEWIKMNFNFNEIPKVNQFIPEESSESEKV